MADFLATGSRPPAGRPFPGSLRRLLPLRCASTASPSDCVDRRCAGRLARNMCVCLWPIAWVKVSWRCHSGRSGPVAASAAGSERRPASPR
eukprot:9258053-Alexandrium_andersonii.AAC.1